MDGRWRTALPPPEEEEGEAAEVKVHPPVWEAGPQYNVRKQRGSSMPPPSPPPPHPFPFIIINAKRGVSLFLLLLYMFSNHSGMRAGTNEYERVPIRNSTEKRPHAQNPYACQQEMAIACCLDRSCEPVRTSTNEYERVRNVCKTYMFHTHSEILAGTNEYGCATNQKQSHSQILQILLRRKCCQQLCRPKLKASTNGYE